MTEHKELGDLKGGDPKLAEMLKEDRLSGALSAYLDGQLNGGDLEEFEHLLKNNPALAREVEEMRNIESQLMELGADILAEPVPQTLLDALSHVNRKS